jgi:replicative DNA helicase
MTTDYQEYAAIKEPPHSELGEQSVIGAIIVDGESFDVIREILEPTDFYWQSHRRIFEAAAELSDAGQPIDLTTVADLLNSKQQLVEAGGFVYLVELAKALPSVANVRAYCRVVKEAATRRHLIRAAGEIADMAYNPEGKDSIALLDVAQARIMGFGEPVPEEAFSMNTVLKESVERIDLMNRSDSSVIGLTTGFKDLDERTGGLHGGDLIIVGARPSMGKTTFAMNIVEACIMHDKQALVFSMEMPRSQLADRLISSVGRIDLQRLRRGKLEHDEWPKLSYAVAKLKDRPLTIDDRGGLTAQQIRMTARKVNKRVGGLSLIVVDYLQLAESKKESLNEKAGEVSRALKALAKELNIPVLVLSQLSRKCEDRPDKRPRNSDLRDSGAIEQDADVIWMLYRDEVYDENSPEKGVAEVITTKQRNGTIGTDYLATRLDNSRFLDLAHQDRPKKEFKQRSGGGRRGLD